MIQAFRLPHINPSAFSPFLPSNNRPSELPNVSRPKIRRTNSFDVDFKIRKLKHNKPILLDRLFVVFDSFESVKSFGIDYRINAGNLPHEINDSLHVKIEKEVEPPQVQER